MREVFTTNCPVHAGDARGVHHQLPLCVPEMTLCGWRDVKTQELTLVRVCKRCKRCLPPTTLAGTARGVHHQVPVYVPEVIQCGWRDVTKYTMQELTLYVHARDARYVQHQLNQTVHVSYLICDTQSTATVILERKPQLIRSQVKSDAPFMTRGNFCWKRIGESGVAWTKKKLERQNS